MVASTSSPPGAEITTFLAPAVRCAEALALLVNSPVHSSTIVDAELAPRQLRRIALRDHADTVAVHDHRIAVDAHLALEAAVRGVVARQMGIGIGIAQVVDGDDLNCARTLSLVQGPQDVAADAAVTIDAHLDCHQLTPLSLMRITPRMSCRSPLARARP